MSETLTQEAFDALMPTEPRRGKVGFPVAPMVYPHILRRISDLLDALTAIAEPDPSNQESPHFVTARDIAIYDEHAYDERDERNALVGWVSLIDANCWVFVPYVAEIELEAKQQVTAT